MNRLVLFSLSFVQLFTTATTIHASGLLWSWQSENQCSVLHVENANAGGFVAGGTITARSSAEGSTVLVPCLNKANSQGATVWSGSFPQDGSASVSGIHSTSGGYLFGGPVSEPSANPSTSPILGFYSLRLNEEGQQVDSDFIPWDVPTGKRVASTAFLSDGSHLVIYGDAYTLTPPAMTNYTLLRILPGGEEAYRYDFRSDLPITDSTAAARVTEGLNGNVWLLYEASWGDFDYLVRVVELDPAGNRLSATTGFTTNKFVSWTQLDTTPAGDVLLGIPAVTGGSIYIDTIEVMKFRRGGGLVYCLEVSGPADWNDYPMDIAGRSDGGFLLVYREITPEPQMRVMAVSAGFDIPWQATFPSQLTPFDIVEAPDADAVVAGTYLRGALLKVSPSASAPPPSPAPDPEPAVTQVQIDVKPGNDRSRLNPDKNGVIVVAILSSQDLDALQVDPYTADLSGAPVIIKDKNKEKVAQLKYKDVNGDGLEDLILYFDGSYLNLPGDKTSLEFNAATYDGRSLQGTGEINL